MLSTLSCIKSSPLVWSGADRTTWVTVSCPAPALHVLCGLSLKQISICPSPHCLTCGSEAFRRRACDNPTAAQRSGGGDGRGGEGLRQLERSTQHLATGDGAHVASPFFFSVVRPGDGCHLVNPTYCSHDKAARPTPTF